VEKWLIFVLVVALQCLSRENRIFLGQLSSLAQILPGRTFGSVATASTACLVGTAGQKQKLPVIILEPGAVITPNNIAKNKPTQPALSGLFGCEAMTPHRTKERMMDLDKKTLAKLTEAQKLVGQKVRSRIYDTEKTVSEVYVADKDDCGLVVLVDFTDRTFCDLADII